MIKKRFFKTKDECEITFEYDAEVEKVALVADHNDWEPIKMKKRKKDGVFYTRVRVPKEDELQFRYLVNGEDWVNDDEADSYVTNEHGSQNSVINTYTD